MANNLVYPNYYEGNVFAFPGPGNIQTSQFRIYRPGRRLKIKSVAISFYVYNQTTGLYITEATSGGINAYFLIGDIGSAIKIGLDTNFVAGLAANSTGYFFRLYPKVNELHQLNFNGFNISESLVYNFTITNRSADNLEYSFSTITEIDEQIIY